MKESYGSFAAWYDTLTFDVDYVQIADFIEEIFRKNNRKPELVLDLACGTGNLTKLLALRGYDMIGIDASADMLDRAVKKMDNHPNILFLNQQMQDFELYGTVDVILCVLDSFNYLTDPREFQQALKLCGNYLNPNGLLLFDLNSPYKFHQVLGNNTFAYETEDIFYVWENDYVEEEQLCDFYLNFFVKEAKNSYRRFDEIHTQRCYFEGEVQELLRVAGFDILQTYDGYTKERVHSKSERIFYECKKI